MGDAVKTDYAHKETDKIIEELEKKLQKEYQQASKEVEAKMNDYLKRFQTKDKKWREWVANGQKSKAEYIKWRQGQMIVGTRWGNLKEELARDLNNSNQIARKIINNDIKDVYALNMNFSTYQVEKELGINTNFCLYSHDTVERIMKDDPEMLPPPGKRVSERIRQGKDVRWNRKTIQSVATQSILQGESIPAIAHRLAQAVGDSNYKSAIRNARTMCTGAQNAGRVDAHDRLKEIGCQLDEYWLAVRDNRTRTSHRYLDNQKRGEDGYFSNGCRFPADPECPDGAEIYNCRCTLIAIPRGFEANYNINVEPEIMGMTYDEWKKARPIYKPITKQSDTNKAIREQYIREYKNAPKPKPKRPDNEQDVLKQFNRYEGKKTDEQILSQTNPKYAQGREYQINCQRTVVAEELQYRGYDVTAKAYNGKDPIGDSGVKCWVFPDSNKPWYRDKELKIIEKRGMFIDTVTKAIDEWGEGSRAIIRLKWMQKYGGNGHFIFLRKDGNELIFSDPQSGKILDIKEKLKKVTTGKNNMWIMRVDNRNLTDNVVYAVENIKG